MTKNEILNSDGEFTYCWGWDFFVETIFGNFHWKDPSYGGDNSFTKTDLDLHGFCDFLNIPYGRDKGTHIIKNYCGEEINIQGI